MQDIAQWPAGANYCAQGTVAEDATAGTHVCTMTVTPGAGNEMQVLYGSIIVGATATAQAARVDIDDGTNHLIRLLNPAFTANTTSGAEYVFPGNVGTTTATEITSGNVPSAGAWIVTGAMRLQLAVSTAAVSVTQAFAVVCRTRGGKPSTVLADSVGAPVLTLNTDKLF